MVKGVYHVQDPVENLKIRINLREVSSAHSLSTNNSEKRPLFDQVIEFSWQEKVYGPRDIADYVLHKKSSYGRQTQLDSRRNLGNLERNGVKVIDMLSEVMLYSYCNDEPFYPPQRNIVSQDGISDDRFDSYLSHVLEPSASSNEDSRQEKVSKRIKREEDSANHMQICLGTRIKKDSSNGAIITNDMSETVLCSIKLMKNGLLIVSPGFSHIIPEESQILHYDTELEERPNASTSSLFINNDTIYAGLKKGFRLSTNRIRTSAGEEFEYSIENVNGVLSPIETEELIIAELRKDVALSEQSRGTSRKILDPDDPDELNKWNHSKLPSPYNQMTSFYAEIVSATGFATDDPLYVRYQLLLPPDDSCILKSSYEAKQKIDRKQRRASTTSVSSEPQQNPLQSPPNRTAENSNAIPEPSTVEQCYRDVGSIDLIGHTQVSTSCPSKYAAEGLQSRYLFGSILQLCAVLGVYFGPSYPFWLVPAFVLWLYLMTGSLTPNTQVMTIAESTDASNDSSSFLSGKSDTDYVVCRMNPYGQYEAGRTATIAESTIVESVAVFGHPFQCDIYACGTASCGASIGQKGFKHISPSGNKATLFLEVYSVSTYERHTLEGCGYVHLPLFEDSHTPSNSIDIDIGTWKPIGDHKSRLVDTFLGGGSHLSNIRFLEVPNKCSSALSKFGTLTESAGVIKFKCNTIFYKPPPYVNDSADAQSRMGTEGALNNRLSSSAVNQSAKRKGSGLKRTVEDILNNYKNTDLLSRSMSRSALRSEVNTPVKGVSLWGDSDGGASQDGSISMLSVDRVADIVARARANTEELRNESKGASGIALSSTFTKPRGVPRPATESRTPRLKHDDLQDDVATRTQAGQPSERSDLTEEGEGDQRSGQDSGDYILSDDEHPTRYNSENEVEESESAEHGTTLLDRFEAAGVTRKKKKSGGNSKNRGISMRKPLNPVNVGSDRGRSKGLDKVFGSDSDDN